MTKKKIEYGTLVRNVVINKSGVVIDVWRKTATVKYPDGTASIEEVKNLEVHNVD